MNNKTCSKGQKRQTCKQNVALCKLVLVTICGMLSGPLAVAGLCKRAWGRNGLQTFVPFLSKANCYNEWESEATPNCYCCCLWRRREKMDSVNCCTARRSYISLIWHFVVKSKLLKDFQVTSWPHAPLASFWASDSLEPYEGIFSKLNMQQ